MPFCQNTIIYFSIHNIHNIHNIRNIRKPSAVFLILISASNVRLVRGLLILFPIWKALLSECYDIPSVNIMICIITISETSVKPLQYKYREALKEELPVGNENAVKCNLLDAGCSNESADYVNHLYQAGRISDALHKMKMIRCDLMEELHQSQRRVDCLDYLIRQTEKEIRKQKKK